jgi:hypothetical protein
MTHGHRRVHRLIWPALAVIVALGFTLALAWRPPPELPEHSTSETRVNALLPEPAK